MLAPGYLKNQQGFTLLELAIVLAILGILMSGILVAVSETTENARRTETRQQLDNLREALYGFAQANGRLPCPALPNSMGREKPKGTNFFSTNGGECKSYFGYIPGSTLGLSGGVTENGLLVDAWGFPIRYAVDSQLTEVNNLADTFPIGPGTSMLIIRSGLNTSGGTETLTDKAAAVILSTGINGDNGTLRPLSLEEAENTNEDSAFISTGYAEESFDDILIWMSPYILYSRLISAGRLP